MAGTEKPAARVSGLPDLVNRASALVREFPECFWFRHPDARIASIEDVRLVIEHLREYGGHRAWRSAQELQKCLLQLSSAT